MLVFPFLFLFSLYGSSPGPNYHDRQVLYHWPLPSFFPGFCLIRRWLGAEGVVKYLLGMGKALGLSSSVPPTPPMSVSQFTFISDLLVNMSSDIPDCQTVGSRDSLAPTLCLLSMLSKCVFTWLTQSACQPRNIQPFRGRDCWVWRLKADEWVSHPLSPWRALSFLHPKREL
jgi:hypothetical protein